MTEDFGNETTEPCANVLARYHDATTVLDESAEVANITPDSAQHASPGNGEANQAGPFFMEFPQVLSSEQLVSHLVDKGLVLEEGGAPKAAKLLEEQNYYRLRGYWISLERNHRFLPGTTFSRITDIAALDSELRHWLLAAIEPIELKLRAQFVRHLAAAYGADALDTPAPFASEDRWGKSRGIIDREIALARKDGQPRVLHNLGKYGRLPIWATVEVMSLGTISKMFGNLRKGDAAKGIASSFGVHYQYLKSALELLTYVRNIAAHSDRFYNRVMKKRPALRGDDRAYAGTKQFPTFLVLRQLYLRSWPDAWNGLHGDLVGIIERHGSVDLKPMGFPEGWKDVLG